MQNVTILGSTGTIGVQTLDVMARHTEKYNVYALAANTSVQALFEQCITHTPQYAVLLNTKAATELNEKLKEAGAKTEVLQGMEALQQISSDADVDVVMAAIVGAAGLKPALAAAQAGKRILLANKETLVMAGGLFMQAVKDNNATLLPIDSEHNAIFQVMPREPYDDITEVGLRKIILTASGGPFRKYSESDLLNVTPEQALKHPNWVMGAKITIDSATLMNKGLEVIEAYWLFNAKPDQIDVVVHPQSIIHSMVEYDDGSVLAQMGNPDMRTPIAYGLGYPERIASGVDSLKFLEIAKLEFEKPDMEKFPCLRLAFDALNLGGSASTVLNAINEVVVMAFLEKQIQFMDIPKLIEKGMNQLNLSALSTLDDIVALDGEARDFAQAQVQQIIKSGQS